MKRSSWLDSANGDTDFPIQNLPCGVFQDGRGPKQGVAIGDQILDVSSIDLGLDRALFQQASWNAFMSAGIDVWQSLRDRLTLLLSDREQKTSVEKHLVPQCDVELLMPFVVTEYTDFYAGKNHAFNVGTMFRGPENALPPNWLSIPIGYNGRASSIVVSGTPVTRPWGQLKSPDEELPHFGVSKRFDFELEMGAIVGSPSNGMISVEEADQMIFGYVLLNDWSARDIQAWEYQPLGPFQAKATATTISPWIVTRFALEEFRVSTPKRERALLPYLRELKPMLYDIDLEVELTDSGNNRTVISKTNFKELYYSSAQQLAHHASSGCPMRTGDLLGSGTISGEDKKSFGSMLELAWGGKEPIELESGDKRSFIEDGDTVTFTGSARAKDYRIGFGKCQGVVMPAKTIQNLDSK